MFIKNRGHWKKFSCHFTNAFCVVWLTSRAVFCLDCWVNLLTKMCNLDNLERMIRARDSEWEYDLNMKLIAECWVLSNYLCAWSVIMGRACACVKRGHSLGFSGLLISRAVSTELFIFGKISLFNFTRGSQSPIIRKTSLNLNRFMIRLPVFLSLKYGFKKFQWSIHIIKDRKKTRSERSRVRYLKNFHWSSFFQILCGTIALLFGHTYLLSKSIFII